MWVALIKSSFFYKSFNVPYGLQNTSHQPHLLNLPTHGAHPTENTLPPLNSPSPCYLTYALPHPCSLLFCPSWHRPTPSKEKAEKSSSSLIPTGLITCSLLHTPYVHTVCCNYLLEHLSSPPNSEFPRAGIRFSHLRMLSTEPDTQSALKENRLNEPVRSELISH